MKDNKKLIDSLRIAFNISEKEADDEKLLEITRNSLLRNAVELKVALEELWKTTWNTLRRK